MPWGDRFLGQHLAVAYYWVVIPLYMLFPKSAYYMTELIEEHAYHTYDIFLETHGEVLKTQLAPQVAINYYRDGDLYMFDEFQTTIRSESRRLTVDNLYDVFINVRDDEGERVKTMIACQQPQALLTFTSSHNRVLAIETAGPALIVTEEIKV